jgi:hypothetical protein
MKDSVVSNNVDEFSSVLVDLGNQAPLLTPSPKTPVSSPDATSDPATPVPSYQPYPWPLLNQVFDLIDKKSNGRAGLLQRVISYLFFGGVAALVNLAVFYIMYYHVLTPLVAKNATLGNILSYIVAAGSIVEISLGRTHERFSSLK